MSKSSLRFLLEHSLINHLELTFNKTYLGRPRKDTYVYSTQLSFNPVRHINGDTVFITDQSTFYVFIDGELLSITPCS